MLSDKIMEGDCVWDVGANIGYYTCLFSQCVGSSGTVVAFEPSPINFTRLKNTCNKLDNVRTHQIGLGQEDGALSFSQGDDELGATSRIVDTSDQGHIEVNIRTGWNLIVGGEVSSPNIIKIDVEGYEYEVLQGLGEYLQSPLLRTIGVEVHFRILKERRMGHLPQKIERLFDENAFIMQWPDSSHIIATR